MTSFPFKIISCKHPIFPFLPFAFLYGTSFFQPPLAPLPVFVQKKWRSPFHCVLLREVKIERENPTALQIPYTYVYQKWCAIEYLTIRSPEKRGDLICSVCLFPWCKSAHHGQFEVTDMILLNVVLGRDAQVTHHYIVFPPCR